MGYTLVGLVGVLLGLILGVEIQARYAAKKINDVVIRQNIIESGAFYENGCTADDIRAQLRDIEKRGE